MSMTVPEKDIDVAQERLRLWLSLLQRLEGIETELSRRLLEKHGISLRQFHVLAVLARHPSGLNLADMSHRVGIPFKEVARISEHLTKKGRVLRLAVRGDTSKQWLRLTRHGREVFDLVAADRSAWTNELLGALDVEDIRRMAVLNDRILSPGEADDPV